MSSESAQERGDAAFRVLATANPAEAARVEAARNQQANSGAATPATTIAAWEAASHAGSGVRCHGPNSERMQQLLVAVCLGAVQLIAALMPPGGAAPITSTLGFGKTSILHLAVWLGSLPGLLALLKAGCPPDLRDAAGRTPLCLAAINNNTAAAVLLIEAGADVNTKDHAGMPLVWKAALQGHNLFVQMLLAAGADAVALPR